MDTDDLSSSPSGRSCPPIGLRKLGIRFRLHQRGDDAGDGAVSDPLVRHLTGPASFRSYVASVEAAGQDLVPYVTVLLEANEYPGARGTTSQPGATNAQIEKVWADAFRSLRAASTDGVARLEAETIAADAPAGEAPRTGPLAYCRKTGETIEPLCPSCLGRLSVCRDETLLRTSGLPAFATTLSRYLYCRSCAAEAGWSPTFYTFATRDGEAPPSGVRIRRRSELYRDLATAIQVGTGSPEGEHFCFECPNRTVCYPAGRSVDAPVPAEDLLFPLAYYENLYLPVAPWPFDFTETAALLGGATPAQVLALHASGGDGGDGLRAAGLESLVATGRQFFFEGDSSGLFALEVLNLKLSAFARLVEGLRNLTAATGRPHLALGPDRVRGRVAPVGNAYLPVRWGLSLAAGDVVTTAPLALFDPIPGEPRAWSIPYPVPEPFVPDGLTRIQSESLFMRLNVRELKVVNGPDGPVARVTADVTADAYRDSDHGRHDLVRLSSDSVPGFDGRLVLAGRKVSAVPRGFLFEGTTAPLSPEVVRDLDPARLPGSWSVEATIVHSFAAPADVMSLGVLFLRLLLSNDRQDGSALNRETAERLAAALTAPASAGSQENRLAEAFRRESVEGGPDQVLFRESDRRLAPPAIPAMLWEETIELALRMASNVPGWSVCASQDDYDLERPARAFDRALEELEMLIERARGGLIGSSGRNGLILEICDDFLDDFREAASHGAPFDDDAPQMTVVVAPPRKGS